MLRLPESLQDASTALSGSGPAYFFYLVEAMVDAGILLGMPRARGLFHRAILQSGAANYLWPRATASRIADQVLTDLAVASPEDLRAAAPALLLAAQRRLVMDLVLGEHHVLGTLSPAGQRVAGAVFLGLTLARRRFQLGAGRPQLHRDHVRRGCQRGEDGGGSGTGKV